MFGRSVFLMLAVFISIGAAQTGRDITVLKPGRPIERELSAPAEHKYHLKLARDQYARIVIQQRGIDVAETVFAPDGKLVAQFDSELRLQNADTVEFVAETAGLYTLDVKSKVERAVGRYEIRIAEIHTATGVDRSLNEAHKLSTESSILNREGRYDEALSFASRALEVTERALGADHMNVASLLNELGNIQIQKGQYGEAEASLQRALAINKKELGTEHPATAESLNSLGLLNLKKNDYGKASMMLQQALEITERTLGTEHPNVAKVLLPFGIVRLSLADSEQAERELQRALSICEKTLKADDPLTARALANLGWVYIVKGDYNRAETFEQRSLTMYEKLLGPDHPLLVYPLQNLGVIAHERTDRRDYQRSLEMYRRALAIMEKSVGLEHIDAAALLNNIANIYKSEGDYVKPLELYQRVLKIAEKLVGPYHGLTIIALGNIANLYAARHDARNAIAFQTRVDERLEKALGLNLAIGSERQKLAYFGFLSERTDRTISLNVNLAPNDQAACALAALVLLQRKGRILDSISNSLTLLRQRFNAEDQKLIDELNSTTAQLAKVALSGPEEMNPEEYRKQIKTLEEEKDELEGEISQRSSEFRAQSHPVTLAAVQAAIPHNAALIEFAVYRPFDPTAKTNSEAYAKRRYVAYILRAQGDVQWKELGEAQAIDTAVNQLREALRDPKRADVQNIARALDEKVMQPVRALIGDAVQLLVSPDGALNLIPFEALVDEQGRYLIHRYSFSYLTSGRDLLRFQVARTARTPSVVIADPLFGEQDVPQLAKVHGVSLRSDVAKRESVTSATDMASIYFAPLAGTVEEAKAIKSLFADSNVLTGTEATESSLKHVTAPRILHIATHGFFLTDTPASSSKTSKQETRSIEANIKIENPLLRSGLALAGANLRQGTDDDGILTALEASGLDLWGTKLVTLSACDTGLGEVKDGEGVYGLRRAFVLAGTETLVMSLWPVSDYVTRRIMTEYYKRLKKGFGRSEALRQVQLDLMKRKGLEHPFYWASFIQSGEWANLDGKR